MSNDKVHGWVEKLMSNPKEQDKKSNRSSISKQGILKSTRSNKSSHVSSEKDSKSNISKMTELSEESSLSEEESPLDNVFKNKLGKCEEQISQLMREQQDLSRSYKKSNQK